MKPKGLFGLWLLLAAFVIYPSTLSAQSIEPAIEVDLRGVNFTAVTDRLFGTGGLLNQNQPFELKAENVVLTPAQVQSFFFQAVSPGGSGAGTTVTGGFVPADFATFVEKVQQLPGTEIKLKGFIEVPGNMGVIDRRPFEAKVEKGEVKIEGVPLTQDQLNSLFSRLRGIAGLREVKIESLVNGQLMEAKFEREGSRVQIKVEPKEGLAARLGGGVERRGKGQEGTSASINNERARDMGKDLDHSIRGRERASLERERGTRSERIERIERGEKIERPERAERAERAERVERPGRIERVEKPERVERVERAERVERPERVERVERAERVERPERVERVERAERVERPERVERVERPERVERIERPARIERIERPERSGRRG